LKDEMPADRPCGPATPWDNHQSHSSITELMGDGVHNEYGEPGWLASIRMSLCYSRPLLQIVDGRVQRLQDISEEDAIVEGVSADSYEFDNSEGTETARVVSVPVGQPQPPSAAVVGIPTHGYGSSNSKRITA
jgi:hypothetical protein